MPDTNSFDITTGADLQEVDNAVNQTRRELGQRYDFKGVEFSLDYKRGESLVAIAAPDEHKLKAIYEVLQAKMIKRGVPVKNLQPQAVQKAHGQSIRQEVKLQQSIDADCAKKIVRFLKDKKLKKVQAAILGEQIRVSSPSRDELQVAMQHLKGEDFGIELNFGNYR